MKLTKVTKELIALLLSFLLLLTTGCQAAAQGDNSAQSKAGDDSAETGPLLARDPADALVGDHLSSNKNGYMSVLYYFGIEKNGDVKVWTYQNGSQEEAQTFQGLKVVEEWKDIVKIKNSPKYIIGLKADGSVC